MDYQSILAATLRRPKPQSSELQRSVMSQPSQPDPEINPDLPLENVSPEDWVPNPKSLVAALKGLSAGGLMGMAKFNLPSVEKALMQDSYGNNLQKSMAGVTHLSPSEFLEATLPAGSQYVEKRSGKVDPFKLERSGLPELNFDNAGNTLSGHESRHRLSALRKAGIDEPLPVRVTRGYGGQMDDKLRELSGKTFAGQDFGPSTGQGLPITLRDVEPLSWGNRDTILPMQRQVDIPLKNVGVLMKPEGAGVTEADLMAYGRGRVPYGKIPPPKPRQE
jgi:hypothetical protein